MYKKLIAIYFYIKNLLGMRFVRQDDNKVIGCEELSV